MSDIIKKPICLILNSLWQPIHTDTVGDAITKLVSGNVKSLDIQYHQNNDGTTDFTKVISMIPLDWENWITLPIKPWNDVVHSQKLTIRVPTVLISCNYSKMPMRVWKGTPSKNAIFVRDGGKCCYTGNKVDKKCAAVDHVIPKSKGGSNDWTNLVLTSKELNTWKGNRLNSEIGLKLLKEPTIPRPIPISHLIREAKHADWCLFINQ